MDNLLYIFAILVMGFFAYFFLQQIYDFFESCSSGQIETAMLIISLVGIPIILLLIFIPAYSDYKIRDGISKSLDLTLDIQEKITEYWKTNKHLPTAISSINFFKNTPSSNDYLNTIIINDGGIIEINLGSSKITNQKIVGKKITLRPVIEKGFFSDNITWVCSTDLEKAYTPPVCQSSTAIK